MFTIKWNPLRFNPWQSIWVLVWNISEWLVFDLGKINKNLPHWVFRQMCGWEPDKPKEKAI
jgi:hypothetical protein